MNVILSPDLSKQVELEIANGRYSSSDELIEQAVQRLLDDDRRGQQRLESLQRIGRLVDDAGLYERTLVPGQDT